MADQNSTELLAVFLDLTERALFAASFCSSTMLEAILMHSLADNINPLSVGFNLLLLIINQIKLVVDCTC